MGLDSGSFYFPFFLFKLATVACTFPGSSLLSFVFLQSDKLMAIKSNQNQYLNESPSYRQNQNQKTSFASASPSYFSPLRNTVGPIGPSSGPRVLIANALSPVESRQTPIAAQPHAKAVPHCNELDDNCLLMSVANQVIMPNTGIQKSVATKEQIKSKIGLRKATESEPKKRRVPATTWRATMETKKEVPYCFCTTKTRIRISFSFNRILMLKKHATHDKERIVPVFVACISEFCLETVAPHASQDVPLRCKWWDCRVGELGPVD